MNTLNRVVLLTTVFVIASCGGGGGGGGGSDSGYGGGGGGYGGGTSNNSPTITNTTTDYSVPENQTSAFQVTATDADSGDTLTYSISGGDSSAFGISANGTVTFNTSPDFENPGDSNTDNVYGFLVSVTDGTATVSESFTVTVTDLTETEGMDGTYLGAGPIQSATVCIEVTAGTCDGATATATTATDGTFSITVDSGTTGVLRGEGGFDPVTNLQFGDNSGQALGQPVTDQNFVVTPLSTIMNDFNNNTEYEVFKSKLGISSDFMIRFDNPFTNLSDANANKAAVVNTQILVLESVLDNIGVSNPGQVLASAIYNRTGDETSLGDTTFIKSLLTDATFSAAPSSDQLINLSAGISAYMQKINANDSSKSHSHFAKVGMSYLSDAMLGVMDDTISQGSLDALIFETNSWIQSDTDWGSTASSDAYVDNEADIRTTTYNLSNSGSSYYSVDNINAKETDFIIYIRDGDVINFAPTNTVTSNHPFHLSTEQDDMDQSGDIGSAEGWDQDSLTLTVSEATPVTLYAHCRFHAGMYAKGKFVRVGLNSGFDMANIDVTNAAAATPMKVKGTVKTGPFKGASGYTYKVYLTRQNASDHTHEFYEYPGLTFYMPADQGYHGAELPSEDAIFKTKSHFPGSGSDDDDGDDGGGTGGY